MVKFFAGINVLGLGTPSASVANRPWSYGNQGPSRACHNEISPSPRLLSRKGSHIEWVLFVPSLLQREFPWPHSITREVRASQRGAEECTKCRLYEKECCFVRVACSLVCWQPLDLSARVGTLLIIMR